MPDKPTVTDEHHQRYNQIMNTAVKPTAGQNPATVTPEQKATLVSSLLSSVQKTKGIGDKVFIFTGKKKIVLDGKEQEVEQIKTVDMTKEKPGVKVISSNAPIPEQVESEPIKVETMANVAGKEKAPPPPPPTPTPPPPPPVQKPVAPPVKPAPPAKKPAKISKPIKLGRPALIGLFITSVLFFIAWTVFWAVFFGLITL